LEGNPVLHLSRGIVKGGAVVERAAAKFGESYGGGELNLNGLNLCKNNLLALFELLN
jgi:hypothetical protein